MNLIKKQKQIRLTKHKYQKIAEENKIVKSKQQQQQEQQQQKKQIGRKVKRKQQRKKSQRAYFFSTNSENDEIHHIKDHLAITTMNMKTVAKMKRKKKITHSLVLLILLL